MRRRIGQTDWADAVTPRRWRATGENVRRRGFCKSYWGIWAALALALIMLGRGDVLGQSADVLHHFERGNELYKSERYEEAIREYEQVLALGYESPELYYNLGNCYYRLERIGKAILYLERARRLAPNDEDILHNLQMARLHVADKVPEIPRLVVQRWLESFRDQLSVDAWAILLIALYGATVVLLVLRVLSRRPSVRRALGRVAVALGGLAVIAALFWLSAARANRTVYAVIMADKVEVRSAPESGATEVFSLHEGFRVQVRKQSGEWWEIRLPDGKVGWVKKDALEVI